ncbi:MAG: prepilin-type N-terminal cleavage/methylation domain-containing protein [Lentisphaeraceae bacterium]|nr:prepilin-type N-terminal cleavage/methylation domain-containing protein [Lentisphaeraceae bacterium]
MNKSKFTLLELMVVIAIMGILLTILLPSLQSAREKSMDAVCRSNNRQIGVAMMLYTKEESGKFPTFYRHGHEYQWWNVMLGVRFMNMPGDMTPAGAIEAKDFISNNRTVFTCPSVEDRFTAKRSIAQNSDIGYFWKNAQWNERLVTRITEVVDGERAIYAGDAGINKNNNGWWLQLSYSSGTNDYTGGPLFNPDYQHNKKANNIYMDLHVAPISRSYGTAFYAQTNNSGYTWMTFFRGWE